MGAEFTFMIPLKGKQMRCKRYINRHKPDSCALFNVHSALHLVINIILSKSVKPIQGQKLIDLGESGVSLFKNTAIKIYTTFFFVITWLVLDNEIVKVNERSWTLEPVYTSCVVCEQPIQIVGISLWCISRYNIMKHWTDLN